MKTRSLLLLGLALGALAARPADAADEKILVLKNGRRIRGTIEMQDDVNYVVDIPGGQMPIRRDDVDHVEDPLPDPGTDDPAPLASDPQLPATPAPTTSTSTAAAASVSLATPPPPVSPPPAPAATPAPDTNEKDVPETPWLEPKMFRTSGLSSFPDLSGVSPGFRKDLDDFLATSPTGDALGSWLAQQAPGPSDRPYVVYLLETLANGDERVGLWQEWLRWGSPDQNEARLIELAGSNFTFARIDALGYLASCATWGRSFPVLLAVLDVPDPASENAACQVIEALSSREAPSTSVASEVIGRARRAKLPEVEAAYERATALLARRHCREALDFLKDAYAHADAAGKVRLLPEVVEGLPDEDAHDMLLQLIQGSETDRELLRLSLVLLPDHGGDMWDVRPCRALLDGQDAPDDPVHGAAISCIAALGHQHRFSSLDDLDAWWSVAQHDLDRQAQALPQIAQGGSDAVAAIDQVGEVFTHEVTQALRSAASGSDDPAVRKAAALALAKRGNRKSIPAILEALKRADGEARSAIGAALQTFAGDAPLDDPDATAAWWREHHPEDFDS